MVLRKDVDLIIIFTSPSLHSQVGDRGDSTLGAGEGMGRSGWEGQDGKERMGKRV